MNANEPMTDQEIRIAIAEACGWNTHHNGRYCAIPNCTNPELGQLFDPLTDLNAMHEAEKHLTEDEWGRYATLLYYASNDESLKGRNKAMIHASARERSIDFLRVKGLWKIDVCKPVK